MPTTPTPDPATTDATGWLDVYQLRCTLDRVHPRVWRRLLVPGDTSLSTLHDVLQVSFAWADEHHHCFLVGDDVGEASVFEHHPGVVDEGSVRVADVAARGGSLTYLYDYTDQWLVHITVETVGAALAVPLVTCLAGENAGPPEEFGGLAIYATFVATLAEVDGELGDYRDVLGRPLDPTRFDLDLVNEVLARL